jgi:hypothetical protein
MSLSFLSDTTMVIVYRLAPAPRSIVLVEPLPIVVTSAINNVNSVNGEIKVVVESKDGTPVAGEVKSQDGVWT